MAGPLSQEDQPIPGFLAPQCVPGAWGPSRPWQVAHRERGVSGTPAPHSWDAGRHHPFGVYTPWEPVFQAGVCLGRYEQSEMAPDSGVSGFPWCRNSCSSSHGESPGLACAELGTNSTGSTGTHLIQTRELRLHLLAAELRLGEA